MKKNVGGNDQFVRIIVGAALVLTGIAGYSGTVSLAVGPIPQALASLAVLLVGLILVVTGVVQKCPINRVLGVDTYRPERPGESEADERPR